MSKLFIKSTAILAFLYIASIVAMSCGKRTAKICKIALYAKGTSYDTVDNSLQILIGAPAMWNNKKTCMVQMPSLISTCNAFTFYYTWTNAFDSTSYILTSDQDIVVGNATLAAGTNLLKAPSLAAHWTMENNISTGGSIETRCTLDTAVAATLTAPVKQHIFNIQCATTDAIAVSASADVFFRN
ncbi:MAG: hypothetical protein RL660_2262 [Bacteroidota bacterium]|jgi:hypothetical protein